MAKITLENTASGYNRTTINDNFQLLESWINNNSLSRNIVVGEEGPNFMEEDLDMNSNDIQNVNQLTTKSLILDGNTVVNAALAPRTEDSFTNVAGQDTFSANYAVGLLEVYINGVKLEDGVEFTATNGTSFTLTTPVADAADVVTYVSWGPLGSTPTGTAANVNLGPNDNELSLNIDLENTTMPNRFSLTSNQIGTFALVDSISSTIPAANQFNFQTTSGPAPVFGAPAIEDTEDEWLALNISRITNADPLNSRQFQLQFAPTSGRVYSVNHENNNTVVSFGDSRQLAQTLDINNYQYKTATAEGNAIVLQSPTGLDTTTTIAVGTEIWWLPTATNTGATTIALDGAIASPCITEDGSSFPAQYIRPGFKTTAYFNGFQWVVGRQDEILTASNYTYTKYANGRAVLSAISGSIVTTVAANMVFKSSGTPVSYPVAPFVGNPIVTAGVGQVGGDVLGCNVSAVGTSSFTAIIYSANFGENGTINYVADGRWY